MIRINQIKVNALYNTKDNIINSICKKLKIKKENIKKINIYKQSLDARDKNNIMFVYEVDAIVDNEKDILKKHKDVFLSPDTTYQFQKNGNIKLTHNPVIIGSGPAGLFCAYFLALNGYNPIIIERGEKVEDRVIFAGFKTNVNEYMQAMDLFVFPSLYEGLGLVLIEAQCSGLTCFTSDRVVPKEAQISDLVQFISLKEESKYWVDKISNTTIERRDVYSEIKEHKYLIQDVVEELEDIYIN